MPDKPQNNWVERRASREAVLKVGALNVWNDVRAALQDACESYWKHYDQERKSLKVDLENGNRFRATFTLFANGRDRIKDTHTTVLVEFDGHLSAIKVTPPDHRTLSYRIDADEKSAFAVHGDSEISSDEISEKILEPFLFPVQRNAQEQAMPSKRIPKRLEGDPSTRWMG